MKTYVGMKNYSRRKPVYGSRKKVKYHQRLLWESILKEQGFPIRNKESVNVCKTFNNILWYDSGWNYRSSLTKSWKDQTKFRKQWMR